MNYKYLSAFLAFSIIGGAFLASSSEASFFRSKKTQDRIDARKSLDMPAGLDGRCNPTCIKDICSSRFPQASLFDALTWCKANCSATRMDSLTGSKTAQPLVSNERYPANVCKNLAPLPSNLSDPSAEKNWENVQHYNKTGNAPPRPENEYPESLEVIENYRILGLSEGADAAAVRKAYYNLALRYHPDKNPNNPQALEIFKKINSANDFLQRYFERQAAEHADENFFKKPFSCEGTCLEDICSPLYAKDEQKLYNLKINCVWKCTNSKNPMVRNRIRDERYPANLCRHLTPAPPEYRPPELNEDEIQQAGAPFSPATNEGLPSRRIGPMNTPYRQQRYAPPSIDEGLEVPPISTAPSPMYQPSPSAGPVIGNNRRSYGVPSQVEDASAPAQRFNEAPPRYPATLEEKDALRMRPDLSYHQDYKEAPEPYIPSSPPTTHFKGSPGEAPPRYPVTQEGRDALKIPQRFNEAPPHYPVTQEGRDALKIPQRFNEAPPRYPVTQEGIDALKMPQRFKAPPSLSAREGYPPAVPGAAPNQRRQSRIQNYGDPTLNSPIKPGYSGGAPFSNTPQPSRALPQIPSR